MNGKMSESGDPWKGNTTAVLTLLITLILILGLINVSVIVQITRETDD